MFRNQLDISGSVWYQGNNTTKPHQNHYYNEYHECILEIANSLLVKSDGGQDNGCSNKRKWLAVPNGTR